MVCPVCAQTDTIPLLAVDSVPTHCNIQWDDESSARNAPRGEIDLRFCCCCGHIFNHAFDPALMAYTQSYENSLHFSPRFRQYADALARDLVVRHHLRHKIIVEIGAGQGDFLVSLCRLGDNRGIGFDPSFNPAGTLADERVSFVQDFYSEKYAATPADFICSRHVLEHIPQPVRFLRAVRRAMNGQSAVTLFFEVPNALYTLRDMGIWDVIYEHCSYFTPSSLATAFSRAQFSVLRQDTVFGGQFLTIEAAPSATVPDTPAIEMILVELATRFGQLYAEKVAFWRETLRELSAAGKRVVVWGGGSKGVTFLNILRAGSPIEFVVDINPRKEGKFIPGTGQKYVPPEFLRDYQPAVVLVMNPLYTDEIAATLAQMGLSPTLMQV